MANHDSLNPNQAQRFGHHGSRLAISVGLIVVSLTGCGHGNPKIAGVVAPIDCSNKGKLPGDGIGLPVDILDNPTALAQVTTDAATSEVTMCKTASKIADLVVSAYKQHNGTGFYAGVSASTGNYEIGAGAGHSVEVNVDFSPGKDQQPDLSNLQSVTVAETDFQANHGAGATNVASIARDGFGGWELSSRTQDQDPNWPAVTDTDFPDNKHTAQVLQELYNQTVPQLSSIISLVADAALAQAKNQ